LETHFEDDDDYVRIRKPSAPFIVTTRLLVGHRMLSAVGTPVTFGYLWLRMCHQGNRLAADLHCI